MGIFNICRVGMQSYKQPQPELFRKVEVIDSLQENEDFQNKPVSRLFSRIPIGPGYFLSHTFFFQAYNNDDDNNNKCLLVCLSQ